LIVGFGNLIFQLLFAKRIRRALFIFSSLRISMSSKKPEKKPNEKKDESAALNEIKKLENSIKAMSHNLNKLKTLFKKKNEPPK
jgi:hypothetical protein